MALTAYDNLGYRSGLAFLAVAWLTTATMAFLAVRRRNFVQHRQWMIRSYVVTFAFVSYRLVDDVMDFYGFASSEGRDAMLAWMCWAVPLLLTEVVLQGRQIMARR